MNEGRKEWMNECILACHCSAHQKNQATKQLSNPAANPTQAPRISPVCARARPKAEKQLSAPTKGQGSQGHRAMTQRSLGALPHVGG